MVSTAGSAPPLAPRWREKVPPAAQKKRCILRRPGGGRGNKQDAHITPSSRRTTSGACFLTKAASMALPPAGLDLGLRLGSGSGSGLAAGSGSGASLGSKLASNTRQLLRHLLCLCLQPGGGWVPRVGRANSVGGWVGAAASASRKKVPSPAKEHNPGAGVGSFRS